MARKPSREEVAVRAYEIYLKRGGEPGRDVEDWVAAEQELSNRLASETERDPRAVARANPLTAQQRAASAGGGDRS
ncbi:MAG TPA: DUF2934 domain-containing protein [Candidatus Acidoferrum sp.]|nr:DUF2934 domain-containing protein [Candidatus Acidoferrum sp.]